MSDRWVVLEFELIRVGFRLTPPIVEPIDPKKSMDEQFQAE
jgi:hypothetical protein